MRETVIAIIGAGELGGSLAHALACADVARAIRLVDGTGRVAEGKALDITQAAAVEGFATELSGSTDISAACGANVLLIADRAGLGEWQGDDGAHLVAQLARTGRDSIIICAGATQADLVDRGVRALGVHRHRLFGSAPEALVAGARSLVALSLNGSPRDVSLSALGLPPAHTVIPWEQATISGLAVTRLISEPAKRQLRSRIAALWPPGPYALASAAAKVTATVITGSRQLSSCFVGPDLSAGVRTRTTALPVRLGPVGIAEIVLPSLSVAEQVALDNAMEA
jgi:malate/lactate dehydrogenase